MNKYGLIIAVLLILTPNCLRADEINAECWDTFLTLLESECTNRNHPFHYVGEFYETLTQMYNETASDDEYGTFSEQFCSTKSQILSCYEEKVKSQLFAVCPDKFYLQHNFQALTYYTSVLKYICANDAQMMKGLLTKNGVSYLYELNYADCPITQVTPNQLEYCTICDTFINCRPYYKDYPNENVVDIWINLHVAAKVALEC